MEKAKLTTVLFLTDLHIGSQWGLWYPKETCANKIQTRLLKYWTDFCNQLTKVDLDQVFLLGDVLDPPRYRQGRTAANGLATQRDTALTLLRMIPRKKRSCIVALMGSGTFSKQYLESNQQLCQSLGGRFCGTTGIFSFVGHNFRIYHGSTTAYIYLELVMGRRRTFA